MTDRLGGIGFFHPTTADERAQWSRLCRFVSCEPKAFSRDPDIGGHVTGSAFLLSQDMQSVLLTHHRKLDRWLQLGGHCDGIEDAAFVAQKEAYEESGLARIRLLNENVLDVDVHEIPKSAKEPAHLHYDVRYLFQAEFGDVVVSDESHALAWIPLRNLEDLTKAPSILRMRDKVCAGWEG